MRNNELILNRQRSFDLDDTLLWKKSAEKQECFVRDSICTNLLKTPCFVVSTHMSKSCLLPVYMFRLNNGITVICRDNFHGWVVTVKTPGDTFIVSLPKDLVYGDLYSTNNDISHLYCEGFKESWVFPYNNAYGHEMTVNVRDDFSFWALMRELNQYDFGWRPHVGLPQNCECIADALSYAKSVNKEMRLYEIFSQTYRATEEQMGWCSAYDVWVDEGQIIELLIKDNGLFSVFGREWDTFQYGTDFENFGE